MHAKIALYDEIFLKSLSYTFKSFCTWLIVAGTNRIRFVCRFHYPQDRVCPIHIHMSTDDTRAWTIKSMSFCTHFSHIFIWYSIWLERRDKQNCLQTRKYFDSNMSAAKGHDATRVSTPTLLLLKYIYQRNQSLNIFIYQVGTISTSSPLLLGSCETNFLISLRGQTSCVFLVGPIHMLLLIVLQIE